MTRSSPSAIPKRSAGGSLVNPLTLSLRWAKDSFYYPVDAGGQSEVEINNRTVEYHFGNKWSLIRLLRMFAATPDDFARLSDPLPHTLKFLVYTMREGIDDQEQARSLTRVFVRIRTFTADEDKVPVALPRFPEKAPEWDRK